MNSEASVYETVTKSIIEELKRGVVPWVRPWKTGASSIPRNALSQRPYRGINILLLWAAASAKGYASPVWLTFRQAQQLGGTVRKGEHGTEIVYVSQAQKTDTNETDAETHTVVRFLRFHSVFNTEQTIGIPESCRGIGEPIPLDERWERVEAFITEIGATIRHGGDGAYYVLTEDVIVLPQRVDFESLGHYFATSLHEHIHFTGHPKRLHRDLAGRFGSRAYAAEELVAELGAAFLAAHLEIAGALRHASYIASWLELLENDRKAIFTAASAATKAADFLRMHAQHGAWIREYEAVEKPHTIT